MILRLSFCPCAVVAGSAGARHDVYVTEKYRRKGADVVARFATGAYAHMRVRHGDGATLIVHCMANGAISGGRLENSLDMTGLAAYAFMRAQKLEGSRGMIKSSIGLGHGSGHAKHQDHAH